MKRPTCTASSPATVAVAAGRYVCDGLAPESIAQQLVRRVARSVDLDALLEALVAVEHARIHCRIDADEHTALTAIHARRHRALLRREMQSSPARRSVLMLVRTGGAP